MQKEDDPMNIASVKIGDEVWFEMPYTDHMPMCGIIKQIDTHATTPMVDVKCKTMCITLPVFFHDVYPTREELIKAMDKKYNSIVNRYKASIQSIDDLIRFMYEHPVSYCEEYTDYDARRAAKERAFELCGVQLENEQ